MPLQAKYNFWNSETVNIHPTNTFQAQKTLKPEEKMMTYCKRPNQFKCNGKDYSIRLVYLKSHFCEHLCMLSDIFSDAPSVTERSAKFFHRSCTNISDLQCAFPRAPLGDPSAVSYNHT